MPHRTPRNPLRRRPTAIAAIVVLTVATLTTGAVSANANPTASQATVDSQLYEQLAADRTAEFFVHLTDRADLSGAASLEHRTTRTEYVYDQLTTLADTSQAALRADLDARGIGYTSFWIANALLVEGNRALVDELAARPDVARIEAHTDASLIASTADITPRSVGWNITDIGAHHAWNIFGAGGQGIVVAHIGTGVQYDHPALVDQYRGNLGGGNFNHNYHWFDPTGTCPTAPCDNNGQGTHLTGTMVGDDGGGNQIGVAPRAQWIAAKGCASSSCAQSHLLAAGQWVLAPTNLNGQRPNPSMAPHVVHNPWGGFGGNTWYQQIINAWVSAGIFPVFALGGSGPACGSAGSPADNIPAYATGAYSANHTISPFSSRGPSSVDGITIKPDITAPGSNIRSSIPGGGYATFSGTSMASAHSAGAVALIWSANPTLIGDVALARQILGATATSVSDLSCGGTPSHNNVWGEGRLNAFYAVWLATTL